MAEKTLGIAEVLPFFREAIFQAEWDRMKERDHCAKRGIKDGTVLEGLCAGKVQAYRYSVKAIFGQKAADELWDEVSTMISDRLHFQSLGA